MTILLIAVAGFVAGAAITAACAVAVHRRWVGEHEARRTWLTHTDVQGIYIESDHNLRLARRLARALEFAEGIYRDQVGDLLDCIAHLERRLQARPRRRPRHLRSYSAMPVYGIGRRAS